MINIKFHENDLNLLLEILGCVYVCIQNFMKIGLTPFTPPLCLCVKKNASKSRNQKMKNAGEQVCEGGGEEGCEWIDGGSDEGGDKCGDECGDGGGDEGGDEGSVKCGDKGVYTGGDIGSSEGWIFDYDRLGVLVSGNYQYVCV